MNAASHSAHIDTFARDNLPPPALWPVLLWDHPALRYPPRLNCAAELVDRHVAAGHGERTAVITDHERLSYRELMTRANRIAHVLRDDLGLVPGNRVLIRSANNPQFLACWLAVLKAGGIAVATMPLLRAAELGAIIGKAEVTIALVDERLDAELEEARLSHPGLHTVCRFNGSGLAGAGAELEVLMAHKPTRFDNVDTAADDTALIAFTSGSTGAPKGTMHFHRDVLVMCDCFPRSHLKSTADDVFIGSPPLAFTFGLGGLATFPLRVGAASVLLESAPPDTLLAAIERHRPSVCFTAPTAYRAMLHAARGYDLSSLSRCVSGGETLPLPVYQGWLRTTGISIMDGLGSTEMLHIFITSGPDDTRPGATGRPIPGYQARVVDDDMRSLPPGEVGRLAVRGPTGCRYLADARQSEYVRDGWNLTGDAYRVDADGYYWFEARADDMIISAGYNIAGPEVEAVLLGHEAVDECAVVAAPDSARGFVPKAFVVLRPGHHPTPALTEALQDYVKAHIAPYKYPRRVEYVHALPRTETGKIQRFRLRQRELDRQRDLED